MNLIDSMGERVGQDLGGFDTVNGRHFEGKRGGVAIGSEGERYGRRISDAVISSSEKNPYSGMGSMDESGLMVEELTVKKYDGQNISIVGTSKSIDVNQSRQIHKSNVNNKGVLNVWEDPSYSAFSDYLNKKPLADQNNEFAEQLPNDKNVSTDLTMTPGGIKTKILSKSGFSEFFMRGTLKGKGVICKGLAREDMPEVRDPVTANTTNLDLNDDTSLRVWLKGGHYKDKKMESLYIFRQIVEFVDRSHSRGVFVPDLRPSCFKLLPGKQVVYLGYQNGKRPIEQVTNSSVSQREKRQKQGVNLNPVVRNWAQFSSRSEAKSTFLSNNSVRIAPQDSVNPFMGNKDFRRDNSSSPIPLELCSSESMSSSPDEQKWYASPEELKGRDCTFSSNIYALGVLLFELIGSFASERACAAAMLDLRHRILPPNFLAESPKEAGFCLWLLHPEASSRPAARDVVQSDFLRGIQELQKEEQSLSFEQDDANSELLLHFLLAMKEQKKKDASKLVQDIQFLEADIGEIANRQPKKTFSERDLNSFPNDLSNLEAHPILQNLIGNDSRLMKNMSNLEGAYFAMRPDIKNHSNTDVTDQAHRDLLTSRDNWFREQKHDGRSNIDGVGSFFDGFYKYARYSKFEVRGVLRNGEFNNSSNVICSLGFDRDQEYFASAGVSKKIKVYEFDRLINDTVDIHFPLAEMPNKSKVSCICWNGYIRNYLASSDYDGTVKLWDAGTGQEFSQLIEHDKRAWSVDFCHVDPTKFASGSDDCSVKIWNINEKKSTDTIKNIANVCCVQFSPHSSHLLAFGSADYKIYCYDLRNVSSPWCILTGHDKAVSYVKFLDAETLVSASTDNTLKLWDLNKSSSCTLSLRGHTNEKNFVGLSVNDGFIACGSETNEVCAYYKSLPMPITAHKFGSIDPISGREIDDDNGQFVSSVCWKKNSDMMIAANSSGCIKLLQMV
ncbi:protein SPA1-RELATED 2-like [Impatiens glandulifera]|uniref:protein SPA1-RELATED 2-like n=1 Tax=Impatiens glandulifera TaxID=253017 RepID=UPI001FB198E0|nr:protein SPA1-RELATED 2-like [Impatiens glandulifera]XP_047337561.1 protein SPA1-RELATED 2-like [Impatiens glandulifera]